MIAATPKAIAASVMSVRRRLRKTLRRASLIESATSEAPELALDRLSLGRRRIERPSLLPRRARLGRLAVALLGQAQVEIDHRHHRIGHGLGARLTHRQDRAEVLHRTRRL